MPEADNSTPASAVCRSADDLCNRCLEFLDTALASDQLLESTSRLLANLYQLPELARRGHVPSPEVAKKLADRIPALLRPMINELAAGPSDVTILISAAAILPQMLGTPTEADCASSVRILLCEITKRREMIAMQRRSDPQFIALVAQTHLLVTEAPSRAIN